MAETTRPRNFITRSRFPRFPGTRIISTESLLPAEEWIYSARERDTLLTVASLFVHPLFVNRAHLLFKLTDRCWPMPSIGYPVEKRSPRVTSGKSGCVAWKSIDRAKNTSRTVSHCVTGLSHNLSTCSNLGYVWSDRCSSGVIFLSRREW